MSKRPKLTASRAGVRTCVATTDHLRSNSINIDDLLADFTSADHHGLAIEGYRLSDPTKIQPGKVVERWKSLRSSQPGEDDDHLTDNV